MKNLMPNLIKTSAGGEKGKTSYYKQLYNYIKDEILSGNIAAGEKLPSLRSLAKSLDVSITTVSQAYDQLFVEGYINSKPQSGYYVNDLSAGLASFGRGSVGAEHSSGFFRSENGGGAGVGGEIRSGVGTGGGSAAGVRGEIRSGVGTGGGSGYAGKAGYATLTMTGNGLEDLLSEASRHRLYDLDTFDFNKWKKCTNKILTEFPSALTFESDPQGEEALRFEIAKYLYLSRGVICSKEQIVIGAGTQQITGHLARILSRMGINHVAVEEPGYLPVKNIFRERGFVMTPIKVGREGIDLTALPMNIRSAVYTCPSNQFPTGAVMPIAKRYALLDWAERNNSIIIEDDYDSELRYFGRPVPALQGLDKSERVVYLGSFSSTLFPAVKISYMVLTPSMVEIFEEMRGDYTQTCSKTEQLTLALFMEKGFYQTGLRKTRNLYSQKLAAIEEAVSKYGKGRLFLESASSGLNVILRVQAEAPRPDIVPAAKTVSSSWQQGAACDDITRGDDVTHVNECLSSETVSTKAPRPDIVPAAKTVSSSWQQGAACDDKEVCHSYISYGGETAPAHRCKSAAELCEEAKALGLQAVPVSMYADDTGDSRQALVLYYHQIPLAEIPERLARLFATWLDT